MTKFVTIFIACFFPYLNPTGSGKLNKAYFGVSKIKRLRDILSRDSLVTIYKSFIRPHLDYGDVIYDQLNNDLFTDKIEQGCFT